jgi:hypothetical protein
LVEYGSQNESRICNSRTMWKFYWCIIMVATIFLLFKASMLISTCKWLKFNQLQ